MENNFLSHKEIIGKRLEALRLSRKKGYKRVDVAEELKMSASTYSDWEGGRRGPDSGKLKMLASYYNTTTDFITGHSDEDIPIDREKLKEQLQSVIFEIADGVPMSDEQFDKYSSLLHEALYKNNTTNKEDCK